MTRNSFSHDLEWLYHHYTKDITNRPQILIFMNPCVFKNSYVSYYKKLKKLCNKLHTENLNNTQKQAISTEMDTIINTLGIRNIKNNNNLKTKCSKILKILEEKLNIECSENHNTNSSTGRQHYKTKSELNNESNLYNELENKLKKLGMTNSDRARYIFEFSKTNKTRANMNKIIKTKAGPAAEQAARARARARAAAKINAKTAEARRIAAARIREAREAARSPNEAALLKKLEEYCKNNANKLFQKRWFQGPKIIEREKEMYDKLIKNIKNRYRNHPKKISNISRNAIKRQCGEYIKFLREKIKEKS